MKVLIIGATGFVGFPIAQALVRAGHIVYGLARTAEKAKQLATEEIIPVKGDANDPAKWASLAASVDVVIDAIGGVADPLTLSQATLNAVTKAVSDLRPPGAPKVSYIYTSGTWVHGDNRKEIVTDTTPTNPTPLVAWRPAFEQQILQLTSLNGIVVRPGIVYGRSGSLLAPLFASTPKVRWPGKTGGRFNLIHVDDVASFFVLVTEKALSVGGLVFDVTNDFTESMDEVLAKVAELNGSSGYEFVEPTNPFEVALSITTLVRPFLARSLLGWTPRKPGLVDGLETYYNAWKASSG